MIISITWLEAASQSSEGWQEMKICAGSIIKTQYETIYTLLSDAQKECKRACDAHTTCKYAGLDFIDVRKRCVLHTACSMDGGANGQYVYSRSTY